MLNYTNKKILIYILLDILFLSIGHMLNINIITLICLIGFVVILITSPKQYFLPIMLFYLPWSPIMKFEPGSFTWFTFIVPIFFVYIVIFKSNQDINISISMKTVLLILPLIILTLFVKLYSAYSIDFGYIMFIFMLIFIPTYTSIYKDEISFEECIIFLSVGIISACISSSILSKYPHMMGYINVYEWENVGLTRLSGFYGDSNFYSAQILVAIFGTLIIITYNDCKLGSNSKILLFLNVMILIYCGLLSVSKMFLLIVCIGVLVWITTVLILNKNIKLKLSIIFILMISIIFIFSSDIFLKQIEMYSTRFGMVDNVSDLTTGRSDIYVQYINLLINDIKSFLLGQGYTDVFVGDILKASHNSIIQTIYQFGILGGTFIILWMLNLNKIIGSNKIYNINKKIMIIIFSFGCFLPWLALDILYFDEFFYITTLFLIGKRYISISKNN